LKVTSAGLAGPSAADHADRRGGCQRYHAEDGGFEKQRFESPINTPIFGPQGELHLFIRGQDMTEYIRSTRQAREILASDVATRTQLLKAEILQQGQELQEANRQLR
jgi:hypothetical protein